MLNVFYSPVRSITSKIGRYGCRLTFRVNYSALCRHSNRDSGKNLCKVEGNKLDTSVLGSISLMINSRGLKLMDTPIIEPPFPYTFNIFQIIRSKINLRALKTLDPEFDEDSFKTDALNAITVVSRLIADGQFDDLDGLVMPDAIEEIKQNYQTLDEEEKRMIQVELPDEMYRVWILCQIATIDNALTAVILVAASNSFKQMQQTVIRKRDPEEEPKIRVLSSEDMIEEMNKCNVIGYWFSRKLKPLDDNWMITQLNHTTVADLIPEHMKKTK